MFPALYFKFNFRIDLNCWRESFNKALFFVSDSNGNYFFTSLYEFHENEPFLSTGIAVFLSLFLLVGLYFFVSFLKNSCSKKGKYYVNPKPRDARRRIRRDSMDMMTFVPMPDVPQPPAFIPPSPPTPIRGGVKVLPTGDLGEMPTYTLRSRSMDGQDHYTTVMNINVGKDIHVGRKGYKETSL